MPANAVERVRALRYLFAVVESGFLELAIQTSVGPARAQKQRTSCRKQLDAPFEFSSDRRPLRSENSLSISNGHRVDSPGNALASDHRTNSADQF